MGLMEQLGGMLGGGGGGGGAGGGGANIQQVLGRFMGGGADFNNGQSQDHQHFGQMMGQASDDDLASTFSHAARGVDAREYRDHVTPGVGGTDPLGSLGGGGLGTIASALLGQMGGGQMGAGQAGDGGMSSLLGRIPGLSHTDPNRMNAQEVAALADYTRQHHPDAFGRAATQVSRQDPGMLQQLLGNKAKMAAAAAMASKFLGGRR
jgi:hypothetical protein